MMCSLLAVTAGFRHYAILDLLRKICEVDQVEDSTAPYIIEERHGHVLWLTLNRPAQRNPLSSSMIAAIKSALTRANDDEDESDVDGGDSSFSFAAQFDDGR